MFLLSFYVSFSLLNIFFRCRYCYILLDFVCPSSVVAYVSFAVRLYKHINISTGKCPPFCLESAPSSRKYFSNLPLILLLITGLNKVFRRTSHLAVMLSKYKVKKWIKHINISTGKCPPFCLKSPPSFQKIFF